MKKAVIGLLVAFMMLVVMIGQLTDRSGASESGSYSYCTVEVDEDENLQTTEVQDKLKKLYSDNLSDVALSIYKYENYKDLDAVITKVNELNEFVVDNKLDMSDKAYIQGYKYGSGYFTYLKENNLSVTLDNNKTYQEKHYKETNTENENDYKYYMEVLSKVNKHCVMTSIDLESAHYQSENPYVKSNLRGQCTWYVWGRVREKTNYELPSKMGNANEWYSYAKSNNILSVGSTPKPNSIIVLGGGDYGHVAIIESIEDGKARITQANYENPCNKKGATCSMEDYARNYYAELFNDSEVDISVLESGTYLEMSIIGYIYF